MDEEPNLGPIVVVDENSNDGDRIEKKHPSSISELSG